MRLWSSLAPVVVLSMLAFGCVSKSDHEALQAQLDSCEEEKALAQAEVISWQGRFDRESTRWSQIEESVATAVPDALSEMRQERSKILDLVPDQVQSEVSTYLDDYFKTVMAGFDRVARDNQDLRVEVLGMQKAMEMLGHDTKGIGRAINESLADEKSRRENLAVDLADVIDQIVEFDQTRINCKGCPDRLRMRDKTRSALLAYHQELTSDLARLQTYAAAPPGSEDTSEEAADETDSAENATEDAEPAAVESEH